jgi:hypothetical protein
MTATIARSLLVVAISVAACGCSPSGEAQWKKPGADPQTTARDSAECRGAAQDGAVRRYPYGASSPALGPAGVGLGQQRDEHARSVAEASLFNRCMQDRGYKQ